MVHMSDPNKAPDSAFDPASLDQLTPGNSGRLLDLRRTPVTVVSVDVAAAMVSLRVTAFEDAGTLWEYPFETFLSRFQMAPDEARADAALVDEYAAAMARLDQSMIVQADVEVGQATGTRIADAVAEAADWMAVHGSFDIGTLSTDRVEGYAALYADLRAWMTTRDLADMETAFAAQYVSNPWSGELVKGHRVVLAELGLCPYSGSVIRRPNLFEGAWSKARRADHIVARLAFVRALFRAASMPRLALYRGVATEGRMAPPRNNSFVSTSLSREVADAFFSGGATSALFRQSVPIERVFMTYLETEAMNLQYKEAEVIVLYEPGNLAF